MGRIAEAWRRIRSIEGRETLESGLDEEIRFHIDQQTEKHRQAGMGPAEARRLARLEFGGIEGVKEIARDEFRSALLEDSVRDVRHGLRVLRRAPAFTAAALLTLALGIGATSAIFSVVRTVLLRPLPYHEPHRIVAVWETNRGGTSRNVIAPANFVAWRERTQTLEHPGMVGPATVAMIVDGQPAKVAGLTFSYDAFAALGVQPVLGRAYTAAEDLGSNDAVIVLSHEFWQRRLGGRADVLRMTLTTDGRPRTVIGVMPAGFTVAGQKADFLIPYGRTLEQLRAVSGRDSSYGVARLRDGVSLEQAYSEMRSLFADLEKENPPLNARRTVMLIPLQEQMVGEIRPALFALVAAVVLVLLVACVNVANLLLARSASRAREVGMRTALGAQTRAARATDAHGKSRALGRRRHRGAGGRRAMPSRAARAGGRSDSDSPVGPDNARSSGRGLYPDHRRWRQGSCSGWFRPSSPRATRMTRFAKEVDTAAAAGCVPCSTRSWSPR